MVSELLRVLGGGAHLPAAALSTEHHYQYTSFKHRRCGLQLSLDSDRWNYALQLEHRFRNAADSLDVVKRGCNFGYA